MQCQKPIRYYEPFSIQLFTTEENELQVRKFISNFCRCGIARRVVFW